MRECQLMVELKKILIGKLINIKDVFDDHQKNSNDYTK